MPEALKPAQLVQTATLWWAVVVVVVLGLLVVPVTVDFVGLTKVYLSLISALLFLLLYGLWVLARQRIEIVKSPLTKPLLFFGLAVVLSTFFTVNYPVKNLLGLGGIYLGLVVVGVLGGTLLPKRPTYQKLSQSLIFLGLGLTLLGFASFLGYGPANWFNSWFKLSLPTRTLNFSLSGSALISAQIIFLALVTVGFNLKRGLKTPKKHSQMVSYTVFLALLVLGLGLHVWALLPGKPANMLFQPPMAGWSVAIDTLRVPKNALIGVGPENYLDSYQRHKPIWMNGVTTWNTAFTQASIPPLTILTTMGLVGLLSWLLLIAQAVKLAFSRQRAGHQGLAWLVAFSLLFQLVLPINVVIITLTAIFIAFYTASQKTASNTLVIEPLIVFSRDHEWLNRERWPQVLVGLSLIIVTGLTGFFLVRSYLAFIHLHQLGQAVTHNDGMRAYQEASQATKLNPYSDAIRQQNALINLTLATALASKADLTETDKQQVIQLLQQAANEAKAATLLDEYNWRNWYTLARVYQSMIGVAKDADQWAVQAYIKAIEVNPTDPSLRVSLGGVFLGQKDYQQAASIFRQAVNIKPDYPNSYYNLAVALSQAGQYNQAKQAYETLLQLLKPDTEDYIKASKELKKLTEQLDKLNRDKETTSRSELNQASDSSQLNQSIVDQELDQVTKSGIN